MTDREKQIIAMMLLEMAADQSAGIVPEAAQITSVNELTSAAHSYVQWIDNGAPAQPFAVELVAKIKAAGVIEEAQSSAGIKIAGYICPSATEIAQDIDSETAAVNAAVSAMADTLAEFPLKDSLKVYAAMELAFKYEGFDYVRSVFDELHARFMLQLYNEIKDDGNED